MLADVSDNSGGGAPNDSTFILRRMLERGVERAAIACIWDPIAVTVAAEAGKGAQIALRLGGKMGPMSGDPLDVTAKVASVTSDGVQYCAGAPFSLGDAAALRVDGVDVVVNSIRCQTFSPDAFTSLGIDVADRQILVVKSMQHFHAGFAPIAADILYVAAPGATMPHFDQFEYQHINPRLWPLESEA